MSDTIERALGKLSGEMAGVQATLATFGRESAEGRAKLHGRLDEIGREQSQISARLGLLEERIERVEPAAQTVADWQAQRSALLWTAGAIGAVITFAVALGNAISSYFIKGSPPV